LVERIKKLISKIKNLKIMAILFKKPEYLFTWKDVKTYLLRSQYNELLNFVTKEFYQNQYTGTKPPFLDTSLTLSLVKFDASCQCGISTVPSGKSLGVMATISTKESIAEAEKAVKKYETAEATAQAELIKSWKVLEFERTNLGINSSKELDELKTAIINSSFNLDKKITPAKNSLNTGLAGLTDVFIDLDKKAAEFNASQVLVESAKKDLSVAKTAYNRAFMTAEFAHEEAQNNLNKALIKYSDTPNITTLQAKEVAERTVAEKKQMFSMVQGQTAVNPNCLDIEDTDFCMPQFKYERKQSVDSKDTKGLDLTLKIEGLTVGSVLWLYFYERMGIFKILGALMDDYNYKGKYTIAGTRKTQNDYSTLMDMICTLHRLGMSSNLRDRICTYQRTLGVSIENNLGIESERNQGFMQNFNKLLDHMLQFYKANQLANAINTGNEPRSSVATQTSILDTVRLLKQQFEPFEYGRNATNTFLGIATVQATLCLVKMLKTEIGIPAQYETPEEFIPAAYRILVEKRQITNSNEVNRFLVYDNCASYGLRLLNDLEAMNLLELTNVNQGSTTAVWLNDVESWVEGYRNAYASVPEGAEAMV
jgi:hypothetical protein